MHKSLYSVSHHKELASDFFYLAYVQWGNIRASLSFDADLSYAKLSSTKVHLPLVRMYRVRDASFQES